MVIKIGSNIASIQAQRRLGEASSSLGKSYERLSSGQRINRASDDAAGLSISSKLQADSRIFSQGIRNINDGISFLNVAEGALSELSNITLRQRELAQQAANGGLGLRQLQSMNAEAYQLTQEFNRIVESTSFNGVKPLDGAVTSLRVQSGYGIDGGLGISITGELSRDIWNEDQESFWDQYYSSANIGTIVGDVNDDGRADLIAFTGSGQLVVSTGNTDGTMTAQSSSANGLGSTHFTGALGDLNGDGNVDLVYYNTTDVSSGSLYVALGRGDGTFQSSATIGSFGGLAGADSANSMQVHLADINGDSRLDIVSVFGDTGNTRAQVRLGNGNGTFSGATSITLGGDIAMSSKSSIVGDINGDGKADLIFTNASTSMTYVAYGGSSGLGTASIKSLGATSVVGITDANHDGYKDVVFNNRIVLGNSSGTFGSATSITAVSGDLQLLDLDGDGETDLVGISGGVINYASGRGDGTFAATKSVAMNQSIGSYYVYTADYLADTNGDGIADLIATQENSVAYVFVNGSEQTTRIARFDLLDTTGAREAMGLLEAQQDRIQAEKSALGASRSRLESSLANLQSSVLEIKNAASRIVDVDIAQESAKLIRQQILQQASASILSQANMQPRIAIVLLDDT